MANILTTNEDPIATGKESALSNYAGSYVTNMLGRGRALGEEPYSAYMGPLTAGSSDLQDAAFQGVGSLALPTEEMGVGGFTPDTFTSENVQQYMNPYLINALQPQIDEARRQSEINRIANASRLTRAGSFGGSRQAVMDAMRNRDTATGLSDIQMRGSMRGFENAQQQFERDQARRMGSARLGAQMAGQGFGAMGQAGGQYGALTGQGYSAAGGANQLLGATGIGALGSAASGLSAVGTAEQNANLARLNAQNKIGSQQYDRDQRVIDADIAQYYEGLGYNKDQISFLINSMKAAPVATTSQSRSGYTSGPGLTQQLTGLGAAGLGSLMR